MITIIKEGNKIICSRGTYESMYKRLGYEIVGEDKKEQPKIVENDFSVEDKEEGKVKTSRTRTKKGE